MGLRMLDPLVHFNNSLYFDTVILRYIESFVIHLLLGRASAGGMDQFVIINICHIVNLDFNHIFSRLLNNLKHFYLLTLIHPDHGKGQANQNDTTNEFPKWRALRVCV